MNMNGSFLYIASQIHGNNNASIISWNCIVLLHGSPGIGKTSLCKTLAKNLAVLINHRYTHGELIEINSHSLFRKWFSEA